MNKEIKEIRVNVDITAMYGNFHITLANTHKRQLIYC